jgi:hypothetical protein
MKKILIIIPVFIAWINIYSQDTLTVQTLTFDSITTRRGTWQFPEGESFRKILMYHTLKCDPQTTHDQYDCGEWDYLTYNILYNHTGVYDSTLYFHPNFTLIDGSSPDSILLTSSPTYYFRNNRHFTVSYPDTLSLLQAEIGVPGMQGYDVLQTLYNAGRSQFLWKADELLNQGFIAGEITGLKLATVWSGSAKHFMIRMKNIELEELTTDTLIAGLDTVFSGEIVGSITGWNEFNFYNPFYWDGQSDIVVDFSFTKEQGATGTCHFVEDPGFNCGITSGSNNYALDLDGISDFLKIPEGTYFNSDFTFETWFLKRSNNNWSRIFDFGNGPGEENVIVVLSRETSGNLSFHVTKDGLSRSFELTDPTPLHEWTHVTLRLTGNIGWAYINGNLSKYGLLQTPPDMNRTVNYIGRSNWAGDKMADVLLDEFRLYNAALSPATIKEHFRREIEDPMSDPNLVLYYKFDEGMGITVADSSQGAHHATGFGLPNWYPVRGPEIYLGFRQYNMRPIIIFERLESNNPEILEELVIDTLPNAPAQVVLFDDLAHPTVATDTITAWQAGYQPVYENWTVVDSVWYEPEDTLVKEQLPYYGEPFELLEEFEIGRYITPYGINLSLGAGFTWIYDVTDYAPMLQGLVDLSAGNQQELIDLKFVFIKGTPPREVKKIDRIWGGLRSFYYKDLDDDLQMSPVTLPLLPDAEQFRVKTRLTGHGHNSNTGEYPHCCEWKDNEHFLLVNGQQAASWHIFQYHDCALNPVYPQGGTWPGAREGWCPGDLVKDHDFEITEFVTGSQVTLDYDITPVPPDNLGMGWGNYVTNMDLIHYGPNHFETDAEIYGIISPNNYQYYSRINPICYGPEIILRNNGSAPLQSVKMQYGVSGGQQQTWQWTGNLKPHCDDTISLPVPGYAFWIGDEDHIFNATVSEPNGLIDQYSDNNTCSTQFNMPDLINIPIVTVLKTNKQAYRFSMEVRDIAGNVIVSRSGLADNTIYKDTLDLPLGCYSIELTDTEDMGLSYWAYPEQGTGYFRLMDLDSNIIRSFNSEFGRTIYYTYHVGEGFYIEDPGFENIVKIYPNPTDGIINVDIKDMTGKVTVNIYNMQGKLVTLKEKVAGCFVLDISQYPSGLYHFVIQQKGLLISKKVIKL